MPIYKTFQKEFFLDEVANFVITNFRYHLDDVKIILPNGYLCNHLQKIITKRLKSTILPSIIPVASISSEKEETFKIPSEQIGKITTLEERIILAEIINSYEALNYNQPKSIALSSSLSQLFFEFETNNVALEQLKNIPTLDQPEHWHFIYNFLEYAYTNWQKKIIAFKKLTTAKYQKLMFDAELARLKNKSCHLVIAGVIGNNKITHDFIISALKLPNVDIILPPLPEFDSNSFVNLKPEDPLYNINKIIQDTKNIPSLGKHYNSIFNRLLVDKPIIQELSNQNPPISNISYIEFDHILHEAEYIANQCHELISNNKNAKIAIILGSDSVKNYFIAKLRKHGLKFTDLIGDNILMLPLTTLLIEIASNISKDFDPRDYASLISHPLVISDKTIELKRKMAKMNHFDNRKKSDILDINSTTEPNKKLKLAHVIQQIISISKELNPNVWNNTQAQKISETLSEVSKITLRIDDLETLPELLKSIISGGRILNQYEKKSNITICVANDVTLMNYDLLIYTNFAQNIYPPSKTNNPWLNNQMIEELGLDSWAARFGNHMYDFYLNLQNKKLLITRSIKNENSGISLPSPFWLKLKHVLANDMERIVTYKKYDKSEINSAAELQKKSNAPSSNGYCAIFPSQISATDIETLIRAPYNFYAKKILGLRLEDEIEDEPKLSEFGNLFHKVAQLYTQNYSTSITQTLSQYSGEILDKSSFPKQTQQFWQLKIEALEKDFILFDKKQRLNAKKIYSEIKGQIEILIDGQVIKIIAIADRIEIDKNNKAIIIDYKTGATPTKKDVLSGVSPQLMIEAIILLEGGFLDIGEIIETINLVYVKIASTEPYINETHIKITKEDILLHKQGMIQLLTHYVTTGVYETNPNSMKYDDYWHLARRS